MTTKQLPAVVCGRDRECERKRKLAERDSGSGRADLERKSRRHQTRVIVGHLHTSVAYLLCLEV